MAVAADKPVNRAAPIATGMPAAGKLFPLCIIASDNHKATLTVAFSTA
jgi:hypothetical protein